jgi:hypothetical protein
MRDEDVSKLISGYLQNTGSDDKELELKELRRAMDQLTAAFASSTQTHEQQKLLVAAISLIAIHLQVNDVPTEILVECQKQLANLNDQRPSELFTPTRKASRQHIIANEEKFCVVEHLCDQYPDEKDAIISDGSKVLNIPKSQLKSAIKNRKSKHGRGDAYSNRSSERLKVRAEHIVQNLPYKRLSEIYK